MVMSRQSLSRLGMWAAHIAQVFCLIVVAVSGALWPLSYIVPTSITVVIDGALWDIDSERGQLQVSNRSTIQVEQNLRKLRALEMDQLDSLFWNDLEPRLDALHFNGVLSAPVRKKLREEQVELSIEEAAITARQRLLRSSPAPVSALRSYRVSYWAAALAASLPLLALFAFRRVHARAASKSLPSLCGRCGYDLRATPYRCPECGSVRMREKTAKENGTGGQVR